MFIWRWNNILVCNSSHQIKPIDTKINHFCGRNHCQLTFSLFTTGIWWLSLSYLKPRIKNKRNEVLDQKWTLKKLKGWKMGVLHTERIKVNFFSQFQNSHLFPSWFSYWSSSFNFLYKIEAIELKFGHRSMQLMREKKFNN
jgi:hypothetical protein